MTATLLGVGDDDADVRLEGGERIEQRGEEWRECRQQWYDPSEVRSERIDVVKDARQVLAVAIDVRKKGGGVGSEDALVAHHLGRARDEVRRFAHQPQQVHP